MNEYDDGYINGVKDLMYKILDSSGALVMYSDVERIAEEMIEEVKNSSRAS